MKLLTPTLTSLAILSLSACQTVSGLGGGGEDPLFGGISADKIAPAVEAASEASSGVSLPGASVPGIDGVSFPLSAGASVAETQIKASLSNETCAQFNMNSLALAAKPEGSGFGLNLAKTVLMGTVAGAASGGIATLGIGSTFVETAVAATASQVVFSGSQPVVNKILPGGADMASKAADMYAAADRLSCPHPTWVEGLTNKDASVLLAKFAAERELYTSAETVVSAAPISAGIEGSGIEIYDAPQTSITETSSTPAGAVDCTGLSDAECIAKVQSSF